MNRAEFLSTTAAALAATGVPAPGVSQVAGGKTFIVPFASAPYPHPSRANGHMNDKKLYDAATHYSNSNVGIFIPDGWHPQDGAIDAVVHFYGWNHDIKATYDTYRLREQMVESKRNAILIVPEGPTFAPDSGDGKLELDENGFSRFMNDVCGWLQKSNLSTTAKPGKIVLSAHSGGYGGAGGAIKRGGMNANITDVILFDSAYGYLDEFAAWARGTDKHFLSIFTTDTENGNVALMGLIQGAQPNVYVWLAKDITLERLKTRNATFILTNDVAHDELLQKYDWYSLFLQSTALAER